MRVLQFGRFWNDQHGGIERHVSLLCRGLAQRGLDVVNLVASQDRTPHDTRLDGYRLVQAPSFGMFARTAMSPALVMKARALHREKPFDVIHLHLPDPLSHFTSLVMPRDPVRVITWHSDIVRQKRLLALYQPFLRREAIRADAIVAATPAHFDSSTQIPPEVPASRRHVIPYGLDYGSMELTPRTAALRDDIRSRAGGRSVIFALGRHVSYKGFDVLVRAMKEVDAWLVLGGDGPLRAELQAQAASLGLGGRIEFTGRIPEADLAAYFHACDIFCLPSVGHTEAFGLVQLEAMACGKPVVCTELGNGVNHVNLAGVTGLAAPPGDPLALARTLDALVQDADLRGRMGAAGKARAHGDYSVDAMANSTVRLYQQLTDRPGKAGPAG
ncbi:MAG: glycosyltransferase [Pseudomonadota bacterium]